MSLRPSSPSFSLVLYLFLLKHKLKLRCMKLVYHPVYLAHYVLNITSYLHYSIPVVARGDLKQGKEGHAKVLKGSVTTHTLTGVVCIAN